MIVAAHAGTGKTHLASMYPDKVIDFICMRYKYFLESEPVDGEASKANPDNEMRSEWPENYVQELIKLRNSDKIILIPPDVCVLALLDAESIPYLLIYPQRSAKEEYRRRYVERGNTAYFIQVFIDGWDLLLERMEKHPHGQHIVLESHQFLSDVIKIRKES